MPDADLEYAGRARKRPPGASDFTQRLWLLLGEHPEGMTLDDLHAVLRDGWLETDAYRVYDRMEHRPPAPYGSEVFKRRAQRRHISYTLSQMKGCGTSRRDGSRWYQGERAPRIVREGRTREYVSLDRTVQQAAEADTAAHVRREQAKARLLQDLTDPKVTAAARRSPMIRRLLDTVQATFEYLSGR